MRRFTADGVRKAFLGLPPLVKLLIVFALLNVVMFAGFASTPPMVFQNTAIIKAINVGAYWDEACLKPIGEQETIDWGAIGPGENSTVTVYLKNEGNWQFTLAIRASNWDPAAAEQYITFSTDYAGQPVAVETAIPVAFVLAIAPDIRDVVTFGFAIEIDADG